jgi:hypothetical protein
MARDKEKYNEYMRTWAAKNKERISAARKARYAANPEKKREWQKRWYDKNREEIRARSKLRYRTETGNLVRAQVKQWREDNPEKVKATNKRYYRNKRLEAVLWLARRRAEKSKLPFTITKSDITVPKCCPYLQVPFSVEGDYVPTLDRIKPELGYVPGNVIVVTKRANRIKNNATWEELLKIGKNLRRLATQP